MNRVVLCGRLAERPRISASSSGTVVAALRLQVPRQGLSEGPAAMDEIDCLAFDMLAQRLHLWGEPGLLVNLEGWLLSAVFLDGQGQERPGCRVVVDAAYWLDPSQTAPERASEATPPDPEPVVSFFTGARSRLTQLATRFTKAGEPALVKGKAEC